MLWSERVCGAVRKQQISLLRISAHFPTAIVHTIEPASDALSL
jgi:hypothetical protein